MVADGGAALTTSADTSPLSLAQERLWFLEQFSPGTATYNIPMVFEVDGPLEHDVLERAVGEIVRRHEPLRTLYPSHGGQPRQAVQPYEPFALPLEDLRDVRPSEEDVNRLITDDISRPFDLERGPIFRGRLLQLDDARQVLVLSVHHIAFDGWSMGVFFRELSALYTAYLAGQPSPLPPLPARYADFSVAQRERLTSEVAGRQIAYWREQLRAPLPVLTLPTDRPRPRVQTFRGQRDDVILPETIMHRLQHVGRQSGATLFMTLAAIYAVFLHRLSGATDLVIGTPVANRTRSELEPLIGFFVNSIPLRISVTPEMTVRQVISAMATMAQGAFAHQDVPFARIVEALNPRRDVSRSPIFQTLLTFDNTPYATGDRVVAGPVTLRRRVASTGTAKVDLTVIIRHGTDGRFVMLETNADLFDAATGTRMLHEFCAFLTEAPEQVDLRVDQLRPGGSASTARPPRWAGEAAPYPRDATVVQLFEMQASRTPEAPAVAHGLIAWTYRDLNERANRLAHVLRSRYRDLSGDETTAPFAIGVCLERSADAVMVPLAVLKAGGAYVPLDPSLPIARLTALAARAQLRLIVTAESAMGRLTGTSAALVVLEREVSAIAQAPTTDPPPGADAGALAYILFTSGTTGTPKPVGVPHRAIVRLVYGLPSIPLGERQTVLHASPLSFDAATFEIWGPLLHGGAVAIAPPLTLGASSLARVIAEHRVTVMWLTASLFNAVVDQRVAVLAPVRFLLTGGETLSVPHVARALTALPGTRLFNGYGPTEATTFTTCHEITARDTANPSGIPIGPPLLNTRVYVLDEAGRSVEPGEAGELWIGGDGLALGYLDDPELTAARFVSDPFAESAGARMFRTGDRGRLAPGGSGTLEFLGRLDDQIKLRGFRIEPGEVEAALRRHSGVAQCAVVAVESRAVGRVLVAFYVPTSDPQDAASPRRLREFLRDHLPEYMIPARWTPVATLPLLSTGKIDRQALKAQAAAGDVHHAEPADAERATGVSDVLSSIWREVLGVTDLRPDDNFFDCGGHSLLAVQMLSKVHATFGVEIGVRTLFEAPTLAGLSEAITRLTSAPVATAAPADAGNVVSQAAVGLVSRSGRRPAADRRAPSPTGTRTIEDVTGGLLEIWRELLGVTDIGPSDNFFDLGGHSLLATRLAAAIEQRFSADIPLSALFTHGTITAQASLIVEVTPDDDWSPIVPIQPRGSEPPLFFVHGIGGEVISFQALARHLGDDIPFYGLEADRRPGEHDDWTVERVAAAYVEAITRLVPDGPYRLGGYSAGGVIAFEMAQQLRRAGCAVSSLVMLDAPVNVKPQKPVTPLVVARLVRNGANWLIDDDFLRSGWVTQRTRLRHRLRVLLPRRAAAPDGGPDASDIRDRMGLWGIPARMSPFIERMARMRRAYRAEPYAGAITVITARTHSLFFVTGRDLGWAPLAGKGVITRIVPGAHDTILREPRVRALAAILRETLQADR